MGFFARNASWLKDYFTPSVTPGFVQPVALSEDVQLVHPYSSGWEQPALNYFFTLALLNPGPASNLFCVFPPADAAEGSPVNQQVWRVILANITIPAGPTGNFNYRAFIGDNGTAGGRTVDYDTGETISSGDGLTRILYPTADVETDWPAIVTRSGLRFTGLGIAQTSSQAASSEGIVIEAWILRAPRGGSIGWP